MKLILVRQFQVQQQERLPLDCMRTGVLIPDTVRAVTLAVADDYATVSFNKLLKLCPYTTTTLTVRSVPALTVPSDQTAAPIETEIPIIYSATFNLKKENR